MQNGGIDLLNGCGAFWVANAITSTVLGGKNRDLQRQIAEESENFQTKMQQKQQLSQEEMEKERIAFRRHLMDVTRQWQQKERAQSLENLSQTIELNAYKDLWPLKLAPSVILSDINNRDTQIENGELTPMNLIFLHTPLLAGEKMADVVKQETVVYNKLEEFISNDMKLISDVKFRVGAHKKECSTNADIMNIHYLMGGLPTLVIMPKYQDKCIYFTAAMWDEQASRPLVRPLFAMKHDPILAYKDENYRNEVIEKLHYTTSIVTGAIRDQYAMLTWGKEPVLNALLDAPGNERMKQYVLNNKGIKNFLRQENYDTLNALESSKNPKLLLVYDQADLNKMKDQVAKQRELLNAK